jgi:hypothetical protein
VIEATDGPLRGKAPGLDGAAGHALKTVCRRAAERARQLLAKVRVADLARAGDFA